MSGIWGSGGGGGATAFTQLTDAPATYAGQAGKVAAVNGGETALEFIAAGGGGGISNEFFAHLSVDGNIPFGPVPVTLIPDTEVYDAAGAYNPATGEFTVPAGQGGKYQFEAQVRAQPGEAATMQMIIAKAPYGLADLLMVKTNPLPNDPGSVYMADVRSVPVTLVAGDVVKALVTWNGAVDATAYAALQGTYFAGRRVK